MSFEWTFSTGEETYLAKVGCAPIIPGTLVIQCRDGINDKRLMDDGNGVLTGTGIGIVDYDTGWIAFDFYSPGPVVGTSVTADYDSREGGCQDDCGKCATYFVRLSVTPGTISGSDQFTIEDAWTRLFKKIERDILPVHVEISREIVEESYQLSIVYHFDIIPADSEPLDTSGLHVLIDDTSW